MSDAILSRWIDPVRLSSRIFAANLANKSGVRGTLVGLPRTSCTYARPRIVDQAPQFTYNALFKCYMAVGPLAYIANSLSSLSDATLWSGIYTRCNGLSSRTPTLDVRASIRAPSIRRCLYCRLRLPCFAVGFDSSFCEVMRKRSSSYLS